MKTPQIILLIFAATMFSTHANRAAAISELHKKYGCTSCHADEKKMIGPAYRDVANRYAKDWTAKDKSVVKASDAPQYLFNKIRNGGSGNWGLIPMVSNAAPTDDEVKAMVKSILDLAKTDDTSKKAK
jgi:cytochrome c